MSEQKPLAGRISFLDILGPVQATKEIGTRCLYFMKWLELRSVSDPKLKGTYHCQTVI